MRALKRSEVVGYFDDLAKGTQQLVRDLILEAAEDRKGPEGWKPNDECIDDIEYHSRDGFIAFDHNRGGLMYQNFSQLQDYWGGGYTVAHKGAAKEIERQIEYGLQSASEVLAEEIGPQDMEHYFGGSTAKLTYGELDELHRSLVAGGQAAESAEKVHRWLNRIQELEYDHLGGESSSVMHEIRVMYHGSESGTHSASVSAAVNTEGPYHRSSIAWAPGVFCEGSKEVEITWTTQAELRRKLKAALARVSKAVF